MLKSKKIKLAVLMTCFNRKATTLAALQALDKQINIADIAIEIYLVDDGCTDGTKELVCAEYPELNLIEGDGSLFWNGGMRLAWNTALKGEYDYYLWLNDDSMLYSDAISRLVSAFEQLSQTNLKPGVMVGTMVSSHDQALTYGGRLSNSRFNPLNIGGVITPANEPLECDFINGNFTLVSAESVNKIGILSDVYTHSCGDYDYGLRLKKAGFTCWVAPGIYGECERNSDVDGCKDRNLSMSERVSKMQSLGQLPPAKEWMHFVRLHGGNIWFLLYAKTWVRGKFPFLWTVFRGRKV